MEKDDFAMGYNIGDVIGQNLAFEQLMASDDIKIISKCLDRYKTKIFHEPRLPTRQRLSKFSPVHGIPLFEDNPRLFASQLFSNRKPSDACWSERPAVFTTHVSLWRSENLRPWDHDRRVEISRGFLPLSDEIPTHSTLYTSPTDMEQLLIKTRKQELMAKLTDPRRLWLSITCANIVLPEYEKPVVRAGSTHSEALIEFVQSDHVPVGTLPPPGFGVAIGDSRGLPSFLQRVPGASLPLGKDVFLAFSEESVGSCRRDSAMMIDCNRNDHLVKDVVDAALQLGEHKDAWGFVKNAKDVARAVIEEEKEINSKLADQD
jgi:hypothetical protein